VESDFFAKNEAFVVSIAERFEISLFISLTTAKVGKKNKSEIDKITIEDSFMIFFE
jgi:hypothetical protein